MEATSWPLPILETRVAADRAAVVETVREAAKAKTPIYPIGGGTRLGLGGRAMQRGIALQLANLNKVVDYPSDDLTITVEAGMTIAELSRRLAEKCQRLPVDVPQPQLATVGGAVAVNAFGPRSFAFGTMRDYVLGLSAVDGMGMEFSAGGRVVKNAAGLNLCRLLAGSLGTLGVFTQVTLLVRPMSEASAFVACDVPSAAAAETRLAAMVHSQVRPVAVELRVGPSLEDGWRLLAGFEGSAVEVGWMTDLLESEWSQGASPEVVRGEDAAALCSELGEFVADVQIGVLPSEVAPLMDRLLELDAHAELLAHAGGTILARFSPHGVPRLTELFCESRLLAAAAGGRMSVLRQPEGMTLDRAAVFGADGSAAAVSRSIKQRFDPLGILNPDRM